MLQLAEKNEKQHVRQIIQQGIRGVLGKFSYKITPDIDGFIDETVVQCDVGVVKDTFVDNSKQMMQMINIQK